MNAPLIVVSGPSGVGKTTVVQELLADRSLPLRRAVTATTRPPRPGEADDREYHFWTVDHFLGEIAANRMLEYAVVHGKDYYGTPRAEVANRAGAAVLLVIDVQGAASIRQSLPGDHLSVFLLPPSWEHLCERLNGRGTEDPKAVARRLDSAAKELACKNEFDVRIVNETLAESVKALRAVVQEQLSLRGMPCSTN
jgi:guanylate kinase